MEDSQQKPPMPKWAKICLLIVVAAVGYLYQRYLAYYLAWFIRTNSDNVAILLFLIPAIISIIFIIIRFSCKKIRRTMGTIMTYSVAFLVGSAVAIPYEFCHEGYYDMGLNYGKSYNYNGTNSLIDKYGNLNVDFKEIVKTDKNVYAITPPPEAQGAYYGGDIFYVVNLTDPEILICREVNINEVNKTISPIELEAELGKPLVGFEVYLDSLGEKVQYENPWDNLDEYYIQGKLVDDISYALQGEKYKNFKKKLNRLGPIRD
ncbi:MAG: hypothetical protein NC217_06080 [Muribaculaceae bacterium]|nr:hypothetical protein [Muribaculaceae bacterium]